MARKQPSRPAPDEAPEQLSFEQAVERVEAIVDRIESGKVGLEQSIAEYERGVALLKRCREILDRAEQRIETLAAQDRPDADSPDKDE